MLKTGLSKVEKITKKSEYKNVAEKGARLASEFFVLIFKKSSTRRIGITVTKTVGNAVVRNRLKRIIKETFRLNKETFPTGDIVVIVRSKAAPLTNEEVRVNFKKIITALKKKTS